MTLNAYRAWLQQRERSAGTIEKYLRDTARFFRETGAPDAPPKEAVAAPAARTAAAPAAVSGVIPQTGDEMPVALLGGSAAAAAAALAVLLGVRKRRHGSSD